VFYLWYVSQPILGSEPIGVYDHPPPSDTNIGYVQLDALPGTSTYLGLKGAALLTKIERYARHLLP
jgi:hypothetical protein